MAFMLHDQGEQWLLQVAFSEEQAVPANFYVGLCSDSLAETDGLADILNEPSGHGYSRALVPSDSTHCVVTQDGDYYKVTFAQATYIGNGGSFGPVNTWFVGTTANNTGKLLFSGPVDPAQTISDGGTFGLTVYVRVK
jgi:hypothetical protein